MMSHWLLSALLVSLAVGRPAMGAVPTTPAQPLPSGVSLLPADALASFHLIGAEQGGATSKLMSVSKMPFKQAIQIETTRAAPSLWSVQLTTKTVAPVKKGDICLATFWLRGLHSMTGEGVSAFIFEEAQTPFDKSANFQASAGSTWQQIEVPFTVLADYPAGGAQMNFQLGFAAQALEIADVSVVNYGKSVPLKRLPSTGLSYAGREPDAPWRKAAEKRIDQIRKGNLSIVVKDAHGRPMPGARVHVAMMRHAFAFGSAVAADELLGQGPDNEKYRQHILQMFNRVVIENSLKWPGWENNQQEGIDAVHWLRDHHIEVRGHNLIWPSWRLLPGDVQALKNDPAALSKRIDDHITDEVGKLKGQIVEWDVVNEPYANHQIMDVLGNNAMVNWYQLAHQADPKPVLFINDYSILSAGGLDTAHQDGYARTIQFLIDHGAPLDGIGLQSHFNSTLTPPTKLLQILDRFGKFGKKLEATEFDIDITDEQLQADYMRDFMTALFSHPSVEGIIMWGFWEGRHWKPNAALFRKDWSIKPNGKEWMNLVFHKWWTDTQLQTDHQGHCKVRGFLGDYQITVQAGGKTKTVPVTLPKPGATLTVTLD